MPDEVECPFEFQHIWDWFFELDGTRNNGMALGAITNVEITFWAQGMGIDILPLERRALLAVDKAFLIHSNTKSEK